MNFGQMIQNRITGTPRPKTEAEKLRAKALSMVSRIREKQADPSDPFICVLGGVKFLHIKTYRGSPHAYIRAYHVDTRVKIDLAEVLRVEMLGYIRQRNSPTGNLVDFYTLDKSEKSTRLSKEQYLRARKIQPSVLDGFNPDGCADDQ